MYLKYMHSVQGQWARLSIYTDWLSDTCSNPFLRNLQQAALKPKRSFWGACGASKSWSFHSLVPAQNWQEQWQQHRPWKCPSPSCSNKDVFEILAMSYSFGISSDRTHRSVRQSRRERKQWDPAGHLFSVFTDSPPLSDLETLKCKRAVSLQELISCLSVLIP